VIDKNGKKGLVIEATTMDTEISFNSIMVSEDIPNLKEVHRYERSVRHYPGPDF
jgi:hypothetical protein